MHDILASATAYNYNRLRIYNIHVCVADAVLPFRSSDGVKILEIIKQWVLIWVCNILFPC